MLTAVVGNVCLLLVILCLLWDRHVAEGAHARQVADLCQRIQAPEVAIVAHDQQTREMILPQPPGLDDDERFWRTKEQLAESL